MPAGVRAAPKLGPEPKKSRQHIVNTEHPETALRERKTRGLGFRPSKRDTEGEQNQVLETRGHRWRVIPTCARAICLDVQWNVQNCISGLREHFPISRPWNTHHLSHAGSSQAEPCACSPAGTPQMPASEPHVSESRGGRAPGKGSGCVTGAISLLSRSSVLCTSCFLGPPSISVAAAYQQFWLHRADFLNIQNLLRTHARQRTRPSLPINL